MTEMAEYTQRGFAIYAQPSTNGSMPIATGFSLTRSEADLVAEKERKQLEGSQFSVGVAGATLTFVAPAPSDGS